MSEPIALRIGRAILQDASSRDTVVIADLFSQLGYLSQDAEDGGTVRPNL